MGAATLNREQLDAAADRIIADARARSVLPAKPRPETTAIIAGVLRQHYAEQAARRRGGSERDGAPGEETRRSQPNSRPPRPHDEEEQRCPG
jgi:hypothetical protein